ncbi:hypothetical protein GQ464_016060 [Rhodocaloribacter litoris]|uniref:hypothetical protein n=1 Tax=Rhodocaloribacter litoris TaxID=2558931 RepID=UPI001420EF80|nr:hypothetical protein [Rhodocaloribacter litoris]QXD14911.1 hypothetical protein GQ464_016060 [Rhodocaloribacter litoris]
MTAYPPAYQEHLERLYAFAQLLTADETEAADLVAATLRRATTASPSPVPLTKAGLLHVMLQIHRSTTGPAGHAAVPEALRARHNRRVVDRLLPAAFFTLPETPRLLLTLCDVEQLSCMEAAPVLEMDPETACRQLAEARQQLSRMVHAAADETERRLLADLPDDPAEWLPDALQRLMKAELAPLPPTLPERLPPPGSPEAGEARPRPAARTPASAASFAHRLRRRLRPLLVAAALIVSAGLVGYGLTKLAPAPEPPETSLILLAARQAASVEPAFHTPSPEQAERYVRDRLGRRVTIPAIDDAVLLGVGQQALVEGAEVPVLLFEDVETEAPITIYTFNYAFLEQHRNRIQLERDILLQIASEDHFDLHDLGTRQVLVWRHRDDIFVAVIAGDAETLRDRIRFPF